MAVCSEMEAFAEWCREGIQPPHILFGPRIFQIEISRCAQTGFEGVSWDEESPFFIRH
jgi:hypothetical protein